MLPPYDPVARLNDLMNPTEPTQFMFRNAEGKPIPFVWTDDYSRSHPVRFLTEG